MKKSQLREISWLYPSVLRQLQRTLNCCESGAQSTLNPFIIICVPFEFMIEDEIMFQNLISFPAIKHDYIINAAV